MHGRIFGHQSGLSFSASSKPSSSKPSGAGDTKAMRSALVDHARRRGTLKRGGGRVRAELDGVLALFHESSPDLLALDDALRRLGENDPELARIVELRFFGGLSIEESARVLASSTASVTRGWRVARKRLVRELDGADN